jgi:hypothetical protein
MVGTHSYLARSDLPIGRGILALEIAKFKWWKPISS